jgi:hypothetical protein
MPELIDSELAGTLATLGAAGAAVAAARLIAEDLPITRDELAGLRLVDAAARGRFADSFAEDLNAVGSWVEESERELREFLADCE